MVKPIPINWFAAQLQLRRAYFIPGAQYILWQLIIFVLSFGQQIIRNVRN